jgi:hypothetical protein
MSMAKDDAQMNQYDEQRRTLLSSQKEQRPYDSCYHNQKESEEASIYSLNVNYKSLYDCIGDVENNAGGDFYDAATSTKDSLLSPWHIVFILSTAFSYGCVMTTLFLITLPLECERLHQDYPAIPKSISLGVFVAMAGLTQLISPLVGRLSDSYIPPASHEIGQRLPYMLFGSILTCTGLLGQTSASRSRGWVLYGCAFSIHMIGINIMYAMMLALLPDQVPSSQTGTANGVLALLLVSGSLFGFALFHTVFDESIECMYELYLVVIVLASIVTSTHAHDRDASLNMERKRRQYMLQIPSTTLPVTPTITRASAGGPSLTQPTSPSPLKTAPIPLKKHSFLWWLLSPPLILKTMWVDPYYHISRDTPGGWSTWLRESYTLDPVVHADFCWVTLSRLFYYCGMSVQTFFLYFIHDMVRIHQHPEAVVATLAMVGQCSAALTCVPVGLWSDHASSSATSSHGNARKPWVYGACGVLALATCGLSWVRTLPTMVAMSVILGAANGVYLTMDTSLAIDALPHDNDTHHGNVHSKEQSAGSSAQMLGIWGVAAFIGSALGPLISGPLLFLLGRQQHDPTIGSWNVPSTRNPNWSMKNHNHHNDDDDDLTESYSIRGYAVILSLSSFYFFLSAMSLRFVKG